MALNGLMGRHFFILPKLTSCHSIKHFYIFLYFINLI